MEIKEIENRRHELLEELCRELNDEQIAAIVTNNEGEPEMVSAILDELGDGDMDIRGEFFFRPLQTEEDAAWVFLSVFTISSDIPEERLSALYEAMSYVNFNLPVGSFSIDKDHRFFCYVLSTLIPDDMENPDIYREMDIAVGNAFAVSDSYIGILTDVLNAKTDADGVVEFLGGPSEAE